MSHWFICLSIGCFIVGFIFAMVLQRFKKSRYDGALVINYSDPTKDVYRLEVHAPMDTIHLKKSLIFEVISED